MVQSPATMEEVPWQRTLIGKAVRLVGNALCGIGVLSFLSLIGLCIKEGKMYYFDMPEVKWLALVFVFGLFLRWVTRQKRAYVITTEDGDKKFLVE